MGGRGGGQGGKIMFQDCIFDLASALDSVIEEKSPLTELRAFGNNCEGHPYLTHCHTLRVKTKNWFSPQQA